MIKLSVSGRTPKKTLQPGMPSSPCGGLFEFIQWVDYCYGSDYVERKFDEKLIPVEKVVVDTRKIKEQESLLGEKDAEIEALRKQIEKCPLSSPQRKPSISSSVPLRLRTSPSSKPERFTSIQI